MSSRASGDRPPPSGENADASPARYGLFIGVVLGMFLVTFVVATSALPWLDDPGLLLSGSGVIEPCAGSGCRCRAFRPVEPTGRSLVGMPLIELRVHGVSGTPPGEMLDVDRVRQVAGDELGRVFERADRDGEPLSDPHHHRTLAYHWGRLTSGSITQGLWLLLAPFGLVNAAQFMLEPPETKAEGRAHMVAGAALRLLGLMLTALFVLAAAVITMDLWAWQRAEAVNGAAIVLGMAGPVLLLAVYVLLARARTDRGRPSIRTS